MCCVLYILNIHRYILNIHRPLIWKATVSTIVWIVFEIYCERKRSISFTKDVIEFGRLLLNKLWNDLIRKRMCPVTLTWDLKQDFLQIRTHNEDWDASRFHWIKSIESNNIETLWFTRAISGLGQSHFLVNGTIKEHLPTSKQRYPESAAHTEEIEESVYADGLITGDATIENVQKV